MSRRIDRERARAPYTPPRLSDRVQAQQTQAEDVLANGGFVVPLFGVKFPAA